jgi:hypothetical protein
MSGVSERSVVTGFGRYSGTCHVRGSVFSATGPSTIQERSHPCQITIQTGADNSAFITLGSLFLRKDK